MLYVSVFLYSAGCLAAVQYVDVLKRKPGLSFGSFAYVVGWPIIIPAIWLLAFVEAARQ